MNQERLQNAADFLARVDDFDLAQIAVRLGYITEGDLIAAIHARDARGGQGLLLDLLVEQGRLTSDKVEIVRGCARDDTTVPASPNNASAIPEETTHIGKYRIIREVGRGGMGVVYEAEDPDLHRIVALKVVSEAGVHPSVVSRLQREATIAAHLSHSNIVRIYEVGTVQVPSGPVLHFIAMEFIRGQTLADLIDSKRASRARLLALMEDVIRAVSYAHSRSIVHRDLKPQNAMIDQSGRIFLTDFGVARAETFGTRLTHSHAIMGTPQYMAPEQVEGRTHDIDAKTDIYALGVMLYECMTGRPAYTSRVVPKLFRQILEGDPTPPSKLDSSVDRDIEVIILKAMTRERERRYGSALELAEDLGRYRRGEPIVARPTGAWHRMRRGLVRRRIPIAAGVVVLAVVVAAGLSIAQARRRETMLKELGGLWLRIVVAKQQFHNETNDPARIRTELEECVRLVEAYRERHPSDPIASYVSARAKLYLGDLGGAESDLRRAISLDSGFVPGFALLARVLMERYVRALLGDPLTARQREREGEPLLREAEEMLRRASRADVVWIEQWGLVRTPEDDVAQHLVQAMHTHYVLGRREEACKALRQADHAAPSAEYVYWLALWSETGEERELLLEEAIRRMPHYASAHFTLAAKLQDVERKIAHNTRAIEIDPKFAAAYVNRAGALGKILRLDEAIADCTRAIELEPQLTMAYVNRALALAEKGEIKEAVADCERALAIDPKMARAYAYRGWISLRAGDTAKAFEDFERAISLDPRLASAYAWRAIAWLEKKDFDAALADASKAIDLDPQNARSYTDRGTCYFSKGDLASAERDFSEAIRLDPRCARALNNRGLVRVRLGNVDAAIDDFTKAIAADPKLAEAYSNRGLALVKKLQCDEAIADCSRALELDKKLVDAYINRAVALAGKGEMDEALADCDRALGVSQGHPLVYLTRARIQAKRGNLEGAVEDYSHALDANPRDGDAWMERGEARRALHDYKGCIADCTRALELGQRKADAYLSRGLAYESLGGKRLLEAAKRDLESALGEAPPEWPHRNLAERVLRRICAALEPQ